MGFFEFVSFFSDTAFFSAGAFVCAADLFVLWARICNGQAIAAAKIREKHEKRLKNFIGVGLDSWLFRHPVLLANKPQQASQEFHHGGYGYQFRTG